MDSSLVNQLILAVATLLASLGGYVLAGINEHRRDERGMKRDLELRALERDSRLDESEHAFQRQTLLELQDALQVMARLTGKTMHFDHLQARQSVYTQLPDGLSDDMQANGVEVRRLASRILDADVRDAVARFTSISVRLSTSPKDLQGLAGDSLESRADAKAAEFAFEYETLSRTLGDAVRAEIAWRPGRSGTAIAQQ